MPLRHFRRQYEQLLQFERGRIIDMMDAEWSARRVAGQLGRSDCVVRRCWGQWSERCHLREDQAQDALDRPVVEKTAQRKKCTRTANCFIGRQPGAGSTFTRTPVSSRTVRRRLAEGYLGSRRPLRVLYLTPTRRRLRLEWCRARGNCAAAEWNQVVFLAKNLGLISAVITFVLCVETPW
ncbi:uncharacterized protein TNCV_347401 [Trichonephila clavipes]|nr:uncharacterized protein TNCV_347401 [Trichonephila clavipes]